MRSTYIRGPSHGTVHRIVFRLCKRFTEHDYDFGGQKTNIINSSTYNRRQTYSCSRCRGWSLLTLKCPGSIGKNSQSLQPAALSAWWNTHPLEGSYSKITSLRKIEYLCGACRRVSRQFIGGRVGSSYLCSSVRSRPP